MAQETFYNLINQSMQESALLVRSSLGRSSYVIAREKALAQVAMLEAAKQLQQTGKYISTRHHLQDMHPANVFIEPYTDTPICIDCIVKFRHD